jgi:hypothetical protein
MGKATKLGSGMGCALAVLGPLTAVFLYPRAKWLFAFALVGIGLLVLNHLLGKDPSPATLADQIESFLNGWESGGWDVDDFEHQHISNPHLRASWRKSMEIGGQPEDWARLDGEKKNQLRELVQSLRNWTTER